MTAIVLRSECPHEWVTISPLKWTDAQRAHVRGLVHGGCAYTPPPCSCGQHNGSHE